MKRISWLNRRNSILILITYVVAFLVPLCALFIYLFPQTEVLLTERLESSLEDVYKRQKQGCAACASLEEKFRAPRLASSCSS